MKISVCDIRKKYGRREVLRGVSFEAESGSIIGIVGVNGSGKSTLLGILSGVLTGKGDFLADGESLMKDRALRERVVGYVPQGTPLIEELSAKDNLLLWYSKKDMESELDSGVLRLLGINEFLKTRVSRMSGGMKKRLSIGCSVAKRPSVILLDEPTSALDVLCRKSISDYLRKFREAGGITIIATHDVKELDLCDKIYVLKDGVLTAHDPGEGESRLEEMLTV
ncbi:MAG: ABC transporter ATP-binding protein [Clostridia bacterium]|nr:ABC transporter ATP-binding protein [Clostridia bacterium]